MSDAQDALDLAEAQRTIARLEGRVADLQGQLNERMSVNGELEPINRPALDLRDFPSHDCPVCGKAHALGLLDELRRVTYKLGDAEQALETSVRVGGQYVARVEALTAALQRLYTYPGVRELLAPKESLGSIAVQVEAALARGEGASNG